MWSPPTPSTTPLRAELRHLADGDLDALDVTRVCMSEPVGLTSRRRDIELLENVSHQGLPPLTRLLDPAWWRLD
jgi:hypothetical protein